MYMSPKAGEGGVAGVTANDYTGAQINFEDLTLTLPGIFCISSRGLLTENLLNFKIFSNLISLEALTSKQLFFFAKDGLKLLAIC